MILNYVLVVMFCLIPTDLVQYWASFHGHQFFPFGDEFCQVIFQLHLGMFCWSSAARRLKPDQTWPLIFSSCSSSIHLKVESLEYQNWLSFSRINRMTLPISPHQKPAVISVRTNLFFHFWTLDELNPARSSKILIVRSFSFFNISHNSATFTELTTQLHLSHHVCSHHIFWGKDRSKEPQKRRGDKQVTRHLLGLRKGTGFLATRLPWSLANLCYAPWMCYLHGKSRCDQTI